MAGINQGQPEVAVGEPIRFGDIDGFELEQHPVSDRLIIRDTENGTVAYVRAKRGGQIGGDGVLIKALKESKPMADDGRTYDTIQKAERAASGWVFVPPGTYEEPVSIDTDGLILQGSGNSSFIDATNYEDGAISVNASNVEVCGFELAASGPDFGVRFFSGDNILVRNVYVSQSNRAFNTYGSGTGVIIQNCSADNVDNKFIAGRVSELTVVGCNFNTSANSGVRLTDAPNCIVANNIIRNSGEAGIASQGDDCIIIGNRIINSSSDGIQLSAENNIVANNRVSGSANSDIDDGGTGTLLDGNLTGASN